MLCYFGDKLLRCRDADYESSHGAETRESSQRSWQESVEFPLGLDRKHTDRLDPELTSAMTETAESLGRKKKVRAAHRTSVTRIAGQARDMLSEGVAHETAKLTQKKEALAAKSELLSKLDAEIVEAVHEDELESEIGHADGVQEQIELMIIELDSALRLQTTRGARATFHPVNLPLVLSITQPKRLRVHHAVRAWNAKHQGRATSFRRP